MKFLLTILIDTSSKANSLTKFLFSTLSDFVSRLLVTCYQLVLSKLLPSYSDIIDRQQNKLLTSSMKVYKLYGAFTASTDALAQVDIQRKGKIKAILLNLNDVDLAAGSVAAEVSFASTAQVTTNDTTGPIASIFVAPTANASEAENVSVGSLDIPVDAGDRLYLHSVVVAGTPDAGTSATAFVYVD